MTSKKSETNFLFSRVPIFDSSKRVCAYKLNINYEDLNGGSGVFPDQAAFENDLENLLSAGIDIISMDKKMFLNFSRSMIDSGYFLRFPSEKLGIKLSINIDPDDKELLEALLKINKEKYSLIIEEGHLKNREIPPLAEYVGADFRNKEIVKTIELIKKKYSNMNLIAIGVDTHYDFEEARERGFDYFIGDFFLKPNIVPLKDVSIYRMNIFKIIKELNRKDLEVKRIESILKKDVSLTVKLLKFINSSKFGLKTRIESIPHALRLLGENEIKNWLLLIVLASSVKQNVDEVVRNTVFRAKFCELMAVNTNRTGQKEQFFLLGILSMLDVYLNRTLEEILEDFSIDEGIKNALLRSDENEFSDILDLVLDYERSEWILIKNSMEKIKIKDTTLANIYLQALQWSDGIEKI